MMPPTRFSIVIPVINESATINTTLEQLIALEADAPFEVIVVDGDTEGKTIGAINNKNVKTMIAEKGRATQMNRGAVMAGGDIIIFLHADTRLPPDALALIKKALTDPDCMGGAFDLSIDSVRPVYQLISKISSYRSRLTRIPYGDQALFFRREEFLSIGGFADIPLMEDVEIMRRIKNRRGKIKIINQPVKTSPRRWEKEGILRCTLRNWLLIILYISGISPERLARFYK